MIWQRVTLKDLSQFHISSFRLFNIGHNWTIQYNKARCPVCVGVTMFVTCVCHACSSHLITEGQVTYPFLLPHPYPLLLPHPPGYGWTSYISPPTATPTRLRKDMLHLLGQVTCYRQTDWLKLHLSFFWANVGPLTLVK